MARRRGRQRVVAAALTLGLLAGCSYAATEPGLFGANQPAQIPPPMPVVTTSPTPTLPVVGEALWTSAEGLGVTVRIAVHAVRRVPGATILDWSVTPLSAPGLESGDVLPPTVDLGLSRTGEDNVAISLLDPTRGRVYRPMVRRAPGVPECLCTQLRLVQLGLVLRQTRLLQVAFAPLPERVAAIDVDIATVPVFDSVPVTSPGAYPRAVEQVDLGRPAEASEPVARGEAFYYPPAGQSLAVTIDRIVAGRATTSLAWSIETRDAGVGLAQATDPPLADEDPPADSVNRLVAAGPELVAGGRTLRARQIRTTAYGRSASECLCTDLRGWPTAANRAGVRISLVTNLPPLPPGTTTVEVRLPPDTTFAGLPVVAARDESLSNVISVPATPAYWRFDRSRPAAGWPAQRWPTPVPAAADIARFSGAVEALSR